MHLPAKSSLSNLEMSKNRFCFSNAAALQFSLYGHSTERFYSQRTPTNIYLTVQNIQETSYFLQGIRWRDCNPTRKQASCGLIYNENMI